MTTTLLEPTTDPLTVDLATALSTRDLETELLGLAGHLAAAQCRFLLLLAEFDRRDGWAGPGLKSCAHWLCWRIGMNLRTATEHVRVAHALTTLPKITEAFAAGRISYSKVRAITRVAGRPTPTPADHRHADGTGGHDSGGDSPDSDSPDGDSPDSDSPDSDSPGREVRDRHGGEDRSDSAGTADTPATPPAQPTDPQRAETPDLADDAEQVLLDLALTGTASHVETIVRATRRAQTDPNRATALRSLSWHHDDDGSVILRGRFTPDDGAHLIATIEALVEHRTPITHPVPSPPEGWRDTAREHAPGAVDDRLAARRADALLALVINHTTGDSDSDSDSDGGPEVARNNATVIVHIEADTGAARIENGPEIPTTTAQRIACHADIQVLLQDKKHNRLYLSRRRRLATTAQISAITVRDGSGCAFPGCPHTRHLQAHHVQHWFHQGDTDLDNLALICGFHHRLIHDLAYRIRWDNGRWLFERPDGTPIPEAGPPLDGNTESLIELNTRAHLRITRDSLTPDWAGERLDPHPILERLLPRHRPTAA